MRIYTPILIAGMALAFPAVSHAQINPFRGNSRIRFHLGRYTSDAGGGSGVGIQTRHCARLIGSLEQ